MNMEKRYTAQQKLEILNFAKEHDKNLASKFFDCTLHSIYRWEKIYDGTLESLEHKYCAPHTPHPNILTEAEVDTIKSLINSNKYITDSEIATILGTNRHPLTIRKYRIRLFGKLINGYKYDCKTMFNKELINDINQKDLLTAKYKTPFYILCLDSLNIYVGKSENKNPCFFTPYISMALKFDNLKDANRFIERIDISTEYKLVIKEIKKQKFN